MSDALIEMLARAIHDQYVREQRQDGLGMGSTPAMASWQDLSDDKKDANRAQARDIGVKLAAIGCALAPGAAAPFAFTDRELDRLARDEHRRWSAERKAAGWTYGTVRDDQTKRHPSLVPWQQLSESEKDKDRDAVRNLPAVLADVDLHIVRSTE